MFWKSNVRVGGGIFGEEEEIRDKELKIALCFFGKHNCCSSSKSQGSRGLTEDAILEILLRLPVKSLVRFKCVCKQWYTIVESQSFIEQHFDHRSNKERLLVRHYNENRYSYALFVDDTCSGFEEPPHLQIPDMISQLFGPVNGVFCLVGYCKNLALLNPATRQLKPLPKLPRVIVEPHLRFIDDVIGFGLDPLTGDHKVVLMRYFEDKRVNAPNYHPIVFIYNLRGDSWRTFEDVGCLKSSYRARKSHCKAYLNGVYYWLSSQIHTVKSVSPVLAFDMTTEKFQEIQVPDYLKLKCRNLTIYGDSIALLSYESIGAGSCEVWVMEKEGSWNRIAVIGPYPDMCWPLCLWKNNELLIKTKTAFLMLCNIFTKKRQLTKAQEKGYRTVLSWVFSYKESIVSIKGERDNCMLWDASPDILSMAWPNKD